MYWVYYPDLRPILAKYEVFNPKNDAVRMSWEDLFEMRMFESFIYKESNVFDRNIQEYATGMDALLESDRIKGDLFTYEHDLWNY
jgi:gliding motility associated protien GldN